ncbi:MAG TPA: SDR family NAD(P)-dependent oxidoreductase [Bacteroidales bacterium]|nr:SDR family NAD(P)-dependent oxidoreductase [Bacteroidales bacterium]
MNYFYITGTSSGIGLALTYQLLSNDSNYVVGYSRRNVVSHHRYKHIQIDFSQQGAAREVEIPLFPNAKHVVLINNAGILGDVKPIGKIANEQLEKTFMVNTVSPTILTNRLLSLYLPSAELITIVNISSGAARHAVESWGGYCASKAAIDMFSSVLHAEQKLDETSRVKVISIAPGIVDTPMQDMVRQIDPTYFPQSERFHQYKQQGMLTSTEQVAKKIVELIANPPNNPIIDLRTP